MEERGWTIAPTSSGWQMALTDSNNCVWLTQLIEVIEEIKLKNVFANCWQWNWNDWIKKLFSFFICDSEFLDCFFSASFSVLSNYRHSEVHEYSQCVCAVHLSGHYAIIPATYLAEYFLLRVHSQLKTSPLSTSWTIYFY